MLQTGAEQRIPVSEESLYSAAFVIGRIILLPTGNIGCTTVTIVKMRHYYSMFATLLMKPVSQEARKNI